MDNLAVKAFAKINMRLEVRGKRPDGYHEIETLFRGIALYDTLTLTKDSDGVTLILEGPDGGSGPGGWNVPEGRENLAWQAADMLRKAYPERVGGVRIRLKKRIPVAAGLGGGSADAAAVLLGMDRLYGLGLHSETLVAFASRLGSDVPFCLAPLLAVGRGRGEMLEPLTLEALPAIRATQAPTHPSAPAQGFPMWILLVKPPFGLSTGAVYNAWRPCAESERVGRGSSFLLLQGMRDHNPAQVWRNMVNDLQIPACTLESDLDAYIRWIGEEAAVAAAGSGDSADSCSVCSEAGLGEDDLRVADNGDKCVARVTADQDAISARAPAGYKVILCGSGPTLAACFAEEAPARRLEERLRLSIGRLEERLRQSMGRRDERRGLQHRDEGVGAPAQSSDTVAEAPMILLTRTLAEEDLDGRFT